FRARAVRLLLADCAVGTNRDRAVSGDIDVRYHVVARAMHHHVAIVVLGKTSRAGVGGFAGWQLDLEEAIAPDRHVERRSGGLQAALAEVLADGAGADTETDLQSIGPGIATGTRAA